MTVLTLCGHNLHYMTICAMCFFNGKMSLNCRYQHEGYVEDWKLEKNHNYLFLLFVYYGSICSRLKHKICSYLKVISKTWP